MTDEMEQNPHPGFVEITTPTPYPEVYVRATDVSMVRVLNDNSCSIWLGNNSIDWTVKASASEVLRRIAAAEGVQSRKVTKEQVTATAKALASDCNGGDIDWYAESANFREEWTNSAIIAFRAAGFEVEE